MITILNLIKILKLRKVQGPGWIRYRKELNETIFTKIEKFEKYKMMDMSYQKMMTILLNIQKLIG